MHMTTGAGEENRRLAGGIATADDYDILIRAQPGLQMSGCIIDAAAE
jgi:hypothetical protein